MAAVYKTLSKDSHGSKAKEPALAQNKQRVLILSSRGVTSRQRHLLNDLATLLPHGRKEAKLDHKKKLFEMCEMAELYKCNNILFLEARKHQDLYMWLSKPPNGPTVKFYVQNLHTLDELHFTGNCLKGSRPILSFDASFDTKPHLVLIKELLFQTFGVPPKARRTKPFVDRVMGFGFADGKIWIRNYEVKEAEKLVEKETDIRLVEVGPRFCLTPIIIQEGSFGGPVIYQNRMFVSPNQLRADLRKDRKYHSRSEQRIERFAKEANLGLRTDSGMKAPVDVLDSSQLFA